VFVFMFTLCHKICFLVKPIAELTIHGRERGLRIGLCAVAHCPCDRLRMLAPDSRGIGASPAYAAACSAEEQSVKFIVVTTIHKAVRNPIPGMV